MTTKQFIEKAKKLHGNKYDYSKVEYVNAKTNVCIICPEHGEFWQTPSNHLQKNKPKGCPKCRIDKIRKIVSDTKEIFIEKARKVHGDKYDYSKVEYKGSKTKICIICPEHGEFWMTPSKHLQGQGCPKCKGLYKTTEEWVKEAKKVHGDKYDYSKTVYKGSHKKLCVICPEHGEFLLIAKDHIKGNGCPRCKAKNNSERCRYSEETFFKLYKERFNNNYDFTNSKYITMNDKMEVCCHKKDKYGNEHGEFLIKPRDLLHGVKCPKCSKRYRPSTSEIIERFNFIHHNKYNYSKVKYVNAHTKITIICPEHGEFKQLPYAHLLGQGCPKCSYSHIENHMANILNKNNIKYEYESNIDGLLRRQTVDFYLPYYNVAIECQGGEHFYGAFNRKDKIKAEANHLNVLKRDIKKFNILLNSHIKLLYYTNITDLPLDIFTNIKYSKIYNKSNFFTNINNLIEKIKEGQ